MSNVKIVIVEDNDDLRHMTIDILRQNGFEAEGVFCAEDLADNPKIAFPDLYILDLLLPGEDGLVLARRIRKTHPHTGIIMMTGRTSLNDRLLGYENGADLYLPKPVDPDELLAAIGPLARRIRLRKEVSGGLRFDAQRLELIGPKAVVHLTQSEAVLLDAFIVAPGQTLERWQVMANFSRSAEGISKSSLEVRIATLRKKLSEASNEKVALKAIRSHGYRLLLPIVAI